MTALTHALVALLQGVRPRSPGYVYLSRYEIDTLLAALAAAPVPQGEGFAGLPEHHQGFAGLPERLQPSSVPALREPARTISNAPICPKCSREVVVILDGCCTHCGTRFVQSLASEET